MIARPFFATPARPEQERRRLLLITYHFPPDPTIGSRRWEQFARFFADAGWGLDVITHHAGGDDNPDARLTSLPSGVRVFGVRQPELVIERIERPAWKAYRRIVPPRAPGRHAESSGATDRSVHVSLERGELRWPPRTVREVLRAYFAQQVFAKDRAWARHAARVAEAVADPAVHHVVISSGPPHMAHEAARRVSEATGIPLVVDMRDPWSLLPMLHESIASPWWYRLARQYERPVVARASLIIANTERARAEMAAAYPAAAARTLAVLNGTDEYPIPPSRHGGRFTIGFAGTIYLGRDVNSLFAAAARVIAELSLTPDEFGIDFIGQFDAPGAPPLLEMARRAGIDAFVSIGPSRSHSQALEFLAQATMLVVFVGFGPLFIPAKTFEYMRFDAWLLALTGPDSAMATLLDGTDADVAPPGDVAAIAAAIARRYREHAAGIRPTCVARDGRFSRARQAGILLDAVERVANQRDERHARRARASDS